MSTLKNKISNWFKLLSFAGILLISSCGESFLDLAPISNANLNSYYTTESDFETAIIGVYDSWQDIIPVYWTLYTEFRSDTYDRFNLIEYEISSNSWSLFTPIDMWEALYKMISNTNIILDRIEDVSFDDESDKNTIKAEARFFRAEGYFALVRFFGAVPLIEHEITSVEALTIGRTDVDEIYSLIEEDFQYAVDNLPSEVESSEYGRITKYAAEGELARVYITLSGVVYEKDRWADALPLLKDIVYSSPYAFSETYEEIFADDGSNEKGEEIILSVLFKEGAEGEATEYASKFIGKYKESARHTVLENGVADSYESADIRKDVNIVDSYQALDLNTWIDGHWINIKFDYLWDEGSSNSGFDFPVIRYTDMYLLYAETLAEIAGSVPSESLEILNQVRRRAGLTSLNSTDVPDIETFRTAMQKERRSELMFECVRWFDLVRTGTAVDALNAIDKGADDTWLLFPIPQEEIDKVGEDILPQNPGY